MTKILMRRREFIKYSACGLTAIALGSTRLAGLFRGEARASNGPAVVEVDLHLVEAEVEMVDTTRIYHWVYAQELPDRSLQASFPGPVVFAYAGDQIIFRITNDLDEPHGFQIKGAGPGLSDFPGSPVVIPPGETRIISLIPAFAGTFMYLDPLNAPVNRVLGLHGALVVLPAVARTATPLEGLLFQTPAPTPYTNPTDHLQWLFDDLGRSLFPGQSWVPVRPEGVAPAHAFHMIVEESLLPPGELGRILAMERFLFRTRIWMFSTVDPVFNAIAAAGGIIDPDQFKTDYQARYFILNGKSGAYAATHSVAPETTLEALIGQPHLVRILNAGMATHSPHLHANHSFILAVNNLPLASVTRPDTVTIGTMENDQSPVELQTDPAVADLIFLRGGSRVDILYPFTRPPDIPGNPGTPLASLIPVELSLTLGDVPQSPLHYPMHCHMELSQTAAGGNYPQGSASHIAFLGEVINGSEVLFTTPAPPEPEPPPEEVQERIEKRNARLEERIERGEQRTNDRLRRLQSRLP